MAITKCDCCEYFGQTPRGKVILCKACNKWFCDGCRYSLKRIDFFAKYMARKLTYSGKFPDHLMKDTDPAPAFGPDDGRLNGGL